MDDMNNTFGLELYQQLYDDKIVKKEDVLILLVHWCLIKHGLKCIGADDSPTFNASEKGSELLPAQWNTGPNYSLRYLKNSKLYILRGMKSDEDLLLNLLMIEDNNVSNVQFPINQTVSELHGPFESMIPSYKTVLQKLKQNLLEPVLPSDKKDTSTETAADLTQESTTSHTELRVVRPPVPGPGIIPPGSDLHDPWMPGGGVGVSDLDPFRRGGGMLYDPYPPSGRDRPGPRRPGLGVPGRLPPGAVPPGARFDPFGPPDVNPPAPPSSRRDDRTFGGFYDDMFM